MKKAECNTPERIIDEKGVRVIYEEILEDEHFQTALEIGDSDPESDEALFDLFQAAFWWFAHHHGGMRTHEYEMMSKIGGHYRPGMAEDEPEADTVAGILYDTACDIEECEHPRLGEE